MEHQSVESFQDLGDLTQTVRTTDEVGPSGIEPLVLDTDATHGDAMQELRAVIEKNYGDHLDRLADDGEKVIINRLVVQSDDHPHIEYQLVEEQ